MPIGYSKFQQKVIFAILFLIISLFIVAVAAFFIFPKADESQTREPETPEIKEKAPQDSPFGMSGAYSRPFIADDQISREDVYKKISALKEPYKDLEDLKAKWIRPGIDINWDLVQPDEAHVAQGKYDWDLVDNLYGRTPQGVSVFANIGINQGLEPASWKFLSEQVEKDYINYVKAAVERYDGDGQDDMPDLKKPIKYWQTHNEPSGIPLLGIPNTDWQGFSHIQEITYKAIKESDPEAKVAMGGFAMGHLAGSGDPKFTEEYDKFFLPILQNLNGKYIDIFDIHYYGAGADWPSEWKGMKNIFNSFRSALNANGYKDAEIWFTETAIPSVPYGEKAQAVDLVKKFVYPLSFGAKKIFWWNMIEGEPPLETDKPSNHMGLIYDGTGLDDPGFRVKKTSYYTYKKLIEILEGSDFDNIETIKESDGIYIYKFMKSGKPVWVAWKEIGVKWEISIPRMNSPEAKITESVPKYESEKGIIDYDRAFRIEMENTKNGVVSLIVGDVPVYVEEK